MKVKNPQFALTILAIAMTLTSPTGVVAAEPISHIHQLEIFKEQIILGTHEGLFKLGPKSSFLKLGKESFDVMGLAVLNERIFASGHPLPGDSRPSLLGLLASSDNGKTWKQVSLKGKVDFHLLEVSPFEIVGGDSASGKLFHSQDAGKTWKIRGQNIFTDIALSPEKSGVGFGISGGNLFATKDGFKSFKRQKISGEFAQIAWSRDGIYLADKSDLLVSVNSGLSWRKLMSFRAAIGNVKASPSLVIVTVGDEVFESNNSGKTFALRN